MYTYLFASLLSIPEEELLNQLVTHCSRFEELYYFPQQLHMYIPTSKVQGFRFLHILSKPFCFLCVFFFFFFLIAFRVGVKRYFTVLLVCVSPVISDVGCCFI